MAPRARQPPVSLPHPAELERICQGLARLDAVACEDWEDRTYSFDARWNRRARHRLASMRTGEGDEWFCVFTPHGVFLKGFWHELRRHQARVLYDGLPKALAPQLKEPAFSPRELTFGGWHDGATWTLRGEAAALREGLALLGGDPKAYARHAGQTLGVRLPVAAVARVLAGAPIDRPLLKALKSERTLAELRADLAEIGASAAKS